MWTKNGQIMDYLYPLLFSTSGPKMLERPPRPMPCLEFAECKAVAAAAARHWCGQHCVSLAYQKMAMAALNGHWMSLGKLRPQMIFGFAFGNERFSDLEKYMIHLHFVKTRVHMWPRSDVSISIFMQSWKKLQMKRKIQCTQFANDFHVKKKLIMNFCCRK